MSRPGAGDSAASYSRGAALLSALIGVTGLLTYAFHSIAAHTLGRDDYGSIGVLWAARKVWLYRRRRWQEPGRVLELRPR